MASENIYLKLYELIINEEQKQADRHHEKINFYAGFIVVVFAGTITAFLQAIDKNDYFALCLGPILILLISELAKKSTSKMYQVLLEKITFRAKIEQKLSLTKSSGNFLPDDFWKDEPIIPTRYIRDRKKFSESEDFILSSVNMGLQNEANRLFFSFQVLAVIMLSLLIFTVITL